MSNVLKERRKVGAVCGLCNSPDYRQEKPYYNGGKLNFVCNSCGHSWQYGRDGGKYAKLAASPKI